jgi:hypothetical protein
MESYILRGVKMTKRIMQSGLMMTLLTMCACTPRVSLETPDKPVKIDLNIKIDHEVRVKLEKDVDNLVKSNPDLF